MNGLMAAAFPALFATGWVGMHYLLSKVGGWHRLAEHFRDRGLHYGKTYRFRSGAVGAVRYKSCLIIRDCEDGVRLSVLPPFRLFHPPLFLPWSAVSNISEERVMGFPFTKADIGKPKIAEVQLPAWFLDRLQEKVTD